MTLTQPPDLSTLLLSQPNIGRTVGLFRTRHAYHPVMLRWRIKSFRQLDHFDCISNLFEIGTNVLIGNCNEHASMRMGQIKIDAVLVILRLCKRRLSRRSHLKRHGRRIEAGVTGKHGPDTAMREDVSELIFLADKPGRPPAFIFAQPGTALLQKRRLPSSENPQT